MGTRITFTGNADINEPMSAMVRRKWEDGRVYHGVLLELYRINGDVYGRAVYTDTQVHDFTLAETLEHINNAYEGQPPTMIVRIFDAGTPAMDMIPAQTSDKTTGVVTVNFKVDKRHGTVDFTHPISMGIARRKGGVVGAGMVLARIPAGDGNPHDLFRVVYEDGPGHVVTLKSVKAMRALFLATAGLEPAVVTVRGSIVNTEVETDDEEDDGGGGLVEDGPRLHVVKEDGGAAFIGGFGGFVRDAAVV